MQQNNIQANYENGHKGNKKNFFWTCFTVIPKVWYTDDVHGYFFSSKKMTMRKFWCTVHVLCKNPGVAAIFRNQRSHFSFRFWEMNTFSFPLINEKHRRDHLCTQSATLKPVDGLTRLEQGYSWPAFKDTPLCTFQTWELLCIICV